MKITSATTPAYSKHDHSAIDCTVTFEGGATYPYTAVANDSTDYGVKLWHDLLAGTYGSIAPFPGVTRDALLDALAAWRDDVQNGGTTTLDHTFDTDADSRSALIAAYMVATLNPAYSCNWKTATGEFVTLTAPDIIAVGNAVLAFIQKCFDTEKALTATVAQYATPAAITAAFDAGMAA